MITRRNFVKATFATAVSGVFLGLVGCESTTPANPTDNQLLQAAVSKTLWQPDDAKKAQRSLIGSSTRVEFVIGHDGLYLPYYYGGNIEVWNYIAMNAPHEPAMSDDEIKDALFGKKLMVIDDIGWSLAGKEVVFYDMDDEGCYCQLGRFYGGEGSFRQILVEEKNLHPSKTAPSNSTTHTK